MARRARPDVHGRRGNVLLLCLLLLALLSAFALAQFSVVRSNLVQADYYHDRSFLRRYAESGTALAVHDLNFHVTVDEGFIGTQGWAPTSDWGQDGTPGTQDVGEADSVPTIGEPGVFPTAIGPPAEVIWLAVYVEDTANPAIKRVLAEATSPVSSVLIESHVERTLSNFPSAGAAYVEPGTSLSLNGNSFQIGGTDTNPDGSSGSESPLPGIVTSEGSTAGDNSADLVVQIDSNQQDQVTGDGGSPSVGEVSGIDMPALYDYFKSVKTQSVAPGDYSDPDTSPFGNASAGQFPVTHVDGDLDLSGQIQGAGILLVEGDLSMSGQSRFDGIIIVRGSTDLTGGGAGIHIFGALAVLGSSFKVTGQADLFYSSDAISSALANAPSDYSLVFYRQLR